MHSNPFGTMMPCTMALRRPERLIKHVLHCWASGDWWVGEACAQDSICHLLHLACPWLTYKASLADRSGGFALGEINSLRVDLGSRNTYLIYIWPRCAARSAVFDCSMLPKFLGKYVPPFLGKRLQKIWRIYFEKLRKAEVICARHLPVVRPPVHPIRQASASNHYW